MKKLFILVLLLFIVFAFISCDNGDDPDLREEILQTALDQIGVPYRYGGESPSDGFDCSGLTYYCYAEHGITIPRASKDLYLKGDPISFEEAQPADIVVFHSPVSHVGIYLSEEEFIHAPFPGYSVRISSFTGYWGEQLTGVVRYIQD